MKQTLLLSVPMHRLPSYRTSSTEHVLHIVCYFPDWFLIKAYSFIAVGLQLRSSSLGSGWPYHSLLGWRYLNWASDNPGDPDIGHAWVTGPCGWAGLVCILTGVWHTALRGSLPPASSFPPFSFCCSALEGDWRMSTAVGTVSSLEWLPGVPCPFPAVLPSLHMALGKGFCSLDS